MKHLIKKILKESVDNRIIDVINKMNLTSYDEIIDFLKEAGYDVDEIEEIYSNYFESISGLELSPTNWMNYYFSPDKLEVVKDDEYKNSIFFRKNGKVVMEQESRYKNENYFWFHNDYIWSFFELYYGMEYDDTFSFLNEWLRLRKTFNLKGYVGIRKAQIPLIWKRLST